MNIYQVTKHWSLLFVDSSLFLFVVSSPIHFQRNILIPAQLANSLTLLLLQFCGFFSIQFLRDMAFIPGQFAESFTPVHLYQSWFCFEFQQICLPVCFICSESEYLTWYLSRIFLLSQNTTPFLYAIQGLEVRVRIYILSALVVFSAANLDMGESVKVQYLDI